MRLMGEMVDDEMVDVIIMFLFISFTIISSLSHKLPCPLLLLIGKNSFYHDLISSKMVDEMIDEMVDGRL